MVFQVLVAHERSVKIPETPVWTVRTETQVPSCGGLNGAHTVSLASSLPGPQSEAPCGNRVAADVGGQDEVMLGSVGASPIGQESL